MAYSGSTLRPAATVVSKPIAVLVDGSALYQSSKNYGDGEYKLNYRALVEVLCREVEGLQPASAGSKSSLWTMWTAAAPDNEGQNKFLDFLSRELHWEVRRTFPSQAFTIEPSAVIGIGNADSARMARLMRFDASIGFAIGRLAPTHRVVVVSDSYPLFEPMARAAEHFGESVGQPVIAFFGRSVDPRWHLAVKQSHAPKLLNLDEFEPELFGIPRKEDAVPAKRFGGSTLVY